jgi:HEAT repeat protein
MSTELPTFNGQPADHWIRARLQGDDEVRWEAVDAIRHLCSPDISIPLFLDTLRNDGYWRARALAAHALFDLAMDRPDVAGLDDALRQLPDLMADPSADVREQISEILSLDRRSDSTSGE